MATTQIIPEQVEELWNGSVHEIDRGDELGVVTRDDLVALMSGSGVSGDDWDGDGPAAHMWQVLAEKVNTNRPGEPTSSAQSLALQDIAEIRGRLDAVLAQAEPIEAELHGAIRRALSTNAPRQAIADQAGVSVPRLYQIRDGRR